MTLKQQLIEIQQQQKRQQEKVIKEAEEWTNNSKKEDLDRICKYIKSTIEETLKSEACLNHIYPKDEVEISPHLFIEDNLPLFLDLKQINVQEVSYVESIIVPTKASFIKHQKLEELWSYVTKQLDLEIILKKKLGLIKMCIKMPK